MACLVFLPLLFCLHKVCGEGAVCRLYKVQMFVEPMIKFPLTEGALALF